MTNLSHAATLRVDVAADVAFDFLADPLLLGRWSLGCFDTAPADAPGLYTGISLYDARAAGSASMPIGHGTSSTTTSAMRLRKSRASRPA